MFGVSSGPAAVFAYLSEPTHLLVASHRGHMVEHVPPPLHAGSWFVLAFGQLRVRIEYTAYDPPGLISYVATYGGRGSHGQRDVATFHLAENPRTHGTLVRIEAESRGGWTPSWLGRLLWPVQLRRLRARLESGSAAQSE